jgi:hypothetical protein
VSGPRRRRKLLPEHHNKSDNSLAMGNMDAQLHLHYAELDG